MELKDSKNLLDKSFKCPKCGNKYFGTNTSNPDNWIGSCKGPIVITPGMGYYYIGCDFVWDRKEDEKYFE